MQTRHMTRLGWCKNEIGNRADINRADIAKMHIVQVTQLTVLRLATSIVAQSIHDLGEQ